jgi:hypothetical protein
MPYRVLAEQALARWRAAQAQMDAALPDTPQWQAACVEEALAKRAYHEAVEAARHQHVPEPPPIEEVTNA